MPLPPHKNPSYATANRPEWPSIQKNNRLSVPLYGHTQTTHRQKPSIRKQIKFKWSNFEKKNNLNKRIFNCIWNTFILYFAHFCAIQTLLYISFKQAARKIAIVSARARGRAARNIYDFWIKKNTHFSVYIARCYNGKFTTIVCAINKQTSLFS